MEARGESRTALARRVGVSRARVTQVLQVLDLDPLVLALAERQPGCGLSEKELRRLRGLSLADQRRYVAQLAAPGDVALSTDPAPRDTSQAGLSRSAFSLITGDP
ncbi:MAG: hypothetical protein M0R74_09995 [Dehalococcoidia bacterium]|nr:hypothetical protein [Dehalococcoidia bacterium]